MKSKKLAIPTLGFVIFCSVSFGQEKEKSQVKNKPVKLKTIKTKNKQLKQIKVLPDNGNKKVENM